MKTFLSFSGGRVEVRTRLALRCDICGTEYHPRVHAYPGLAIGLGLVAILAMVVAAVLWHQGRVDRTWFLAAKVLAALIVAVLAAMASRLHGKLLTPNFHIPASGGEPSHGDIVLECPRCGSAAARVASGEKRPPGPAAPSRFDRAS